MSLLQKCDGPECPRCGCRDTGVERRRHRWTGESTAMRCNHCGLVWWPARWGPANGNGVPAAVPPPPAVQVPALAEVSPGGAVIYRPVRCPECGSTKTKVTSSKLPVRYHKCLACKKPFKSVEQ